MPIFNEEISWKEKIDPAFDKLLKVYKSYLRVCKLTGNEDYISLSDQYLKVFEMEGFPVLVKEYENQFKPDKKTLDELINSGASKDISLIFKVKEDNHFQTIFKLIDGLSIAESQTFYKYQFEPLFSFEKWTSFCKGKSETKLQDWYEDLRNDVRALTYHALIKDGLEKNNKNNGKELKVSDGKMIKIMIPRIFDVVSRLKHKKPILMLVDEARKGCDEALFNTIQIDKTLVDFDWVRKRIRKAQFSGDANFFKNLGEAIKVSPLDHTLIHNELLLVLLEFWDKGLCRLKYKDLFNLLESSGISVQVDRKIKDKTKSSDKFGSFKRYMSRLKEQNILT